jgi:hypothetical protein
MTGYDAGESESRKEQGMSLAEAVKHSLVLGAREIAVTIAERTGTVTADDVGREMEKSGLGSLGPAAGSLFKDDRFAFTGNYVKSSKKSNHSRLLRVWKLK